MPRVVTGAEASNTKTDSMTAAWLEVLLLLREAGEEPSKSKEKPKKKGGRSEQFQRQTAESFHSVASATSAASQATALTELRCAGGRGCAGGSSWGDESLLHDGHNAPHGGE
eukprot:Skav200141  [mRNA]  locus=scaffold2013:161258:165909:+ [translate_table: standard]